MVMCDCVCSDSRKHTGRERGRVILEIYEHHAAFPPPLPYLLRWIPTFPENFRTGAYRTSSFFTVKIENWDMIISYWSTLNYPITPKRYWSHPSGKPPVMHDPNRQFSMPGQAQLRAGGASHSSGYNVHAKLMTNFKRCLSTTPSSTPHSHLLKFSLLSEQDQPSLLLSSQGVFVRLLTFLLPNKNLYFSSRISTLLTENCFFCFLNQ